MSKIGYKEISVPQSTTVTITDRAVTVKGSKGELAFAIPPGISVEQTDGILRVRRANERKETKALHGLFRSILANAVRGVESPWEKRLQIVGTGFNVKMEGENLVFKVGYSHLVTFQKPPGVVFKTDGPNKIIVSGIDKQLVGEIAHRIKCIRKPDAYKGKGIRYEGEEIKLKPGKKAKA
ncbi:MAG: 50S ribosomal protein L6 [Patescibacteria group bacterium]|nr:50S ribosomal protein L6 [Patescibacteria group bacterium]